MVDEVDQGVEVGRCPSGRSAAPSGLSPSGSQAKPAVTNAVYIPRCAISTRWEKGAALLLDYAYTQRDNAVHWGTANWGRLLPFGVYYEGVEKIDLSEPGPYPFVEAIILGVGRLAFIGGRRFDEAFGPRAASVDTLPQGGDGEAGSVRSKGSAVGAAETPEARP